MQMRSNHEETRLSLDVSEVVSLKVLGAQKGETVVERSDDGKDQKIEVAMKIKSIKATWNINVQIPTVPNFLIEDINEREQGKYPISDFPESVLREIAEAWTVNFLSRAKEMRVSRDK